MKILLSVLLSGAFLLAACSASSADNSQKLRISDAWSKATPPNAKVAGGYFTVENKGGTADRLLRVESTSASRVEIHEMSDVGGVARMREVTDGQPLPAGASTALKPGGFHLMFIEPKQPFVEGQKVKATLVFEKAGRLPVVFDVRPLTASGNSGHDHH